MHHSLAHDLTGGVEVVQTTENAVHDVPDMFGNEIKAGGDDARELAILVGRVYWHIGSNCERRKQEVLDSVLGFIVCFA